METKYLEQLKGKKHSNPSQGAKRIATELQLFEMSPIAEDIQKFADPFFTEDKDEDEDEDEE